MPSLRVGACLAAVLLVGCGVSKSEHETVVAELEECRANALRWETLYQESVEERRQALDQALEMLPAAHDELRSQINLRLDEVTQSLDSTLRSEVQESVYELAEAIAEGYSVLQDENEQLEAQLAESRRLIESVLEKTGSIEERVGSEKEAFLADRQSLLLEIGEVEAYLRDWQYKHVECKGCDERLRINKRERDALAQLQEEILSRLAEVRQKITSIG
ncbi:MAG: hypothetical protein R3244_00715 [Thermoanaerobaculia bacterium]|nr:hypothetical protein [Thermoanaerobaculia bacterium]